MADTDLYSMLCEYARKTNNAYINKEQFIESLTVSAKFKARKSPGWKRWAESPRETFQSEMDGLIDKKLVFIEIQNKFDYIYVPAFYVERVRELWLKCEEKGELAFPDITLVKDEIPIEKFSTIDFQTEFHELLKNPPEDDLPVLRLILPDGAGSVIIISSFLCERFLETAVNKLRFFLIEKNFKQVFLSKMTSHLPNLAKLIESSFNTLILNPNECISKIKEAEASMFLIWTTLCAQIEESFADKSDGQDKEMALLQCACVVKYFSTYYRNIAIENDENIQLNLIFEDYLNKEPYFYTMKNITGFIDNAGNTLVDRFSREAIVNLIKRKTAVSSDSNHLPDLIAFLDSDNEKWYVNKCNLYEGFEHCRKTNRPKIYKELNTRWHLTLKNYKTDPAMKDDTLFEKFVTALTMDESPLLAAVHSDGKFVITKEELPANGESALLAGKYFNNGSLKPLTKLLNIERAATLKSIRSSLPFWYSIPPIVAICRFFKNRLS